MAASPADRRETDTVNRHFTTRNQNTPLTACHGQRPAETAGSDRTAPPHSLSCSRSLYTAGLELGGSMRRSVVIMGVSAVLTACAVSPPPPAAAVVAAVPAVKAPKSGLDLSGFDRSMRPQDDLFRFTNGAWLASTEIPADQSSYGTFDILADEAERAVHALLVAASQQPDRPHGSPTQKLGDFYLAFMDTAQIESVGLAPLAAELRKIDALRTPRDLSRYIGYAQRLGIAHPIAFQVAPDSRNTTQYLAGIAQSGLTMPDRDYYLRPDAKYSQIRTRFIDYAYRLLALAGVVEAKSAAQRIAALETRFANYHWTKVQNRDPVRTYNKIKVSELARLAPGLDWYAFLQGAAAAPLEINIHQPSFVAGIAQMVRNVPAGDWRAYFKFRLLDTAAPFLAARFADLHFEFHEQALRGVIERRPRWKRAVHVVNQSLGELVGREYVAHHFTADSKARAAELVQNLLTAFERSIDGLDWMGPATRAAAKEKLAKVTVKVGYPDVWRDYAALSVIATDLIGNRQRVAEFEFNRAVNRIGKPVDRTEWLMTPQTVNAYYYPSHNEILVPAAILQPPLFDPTADPAVNYGGIGGVIGHELSRGFDDQGRQFDGDGNLRDWWSFEDRERFQRRATALLAQYSAYAAIDGRKSNGVRALGENVGDVSGLAVAYRAYRTSLNGSAAPEIDGFTGPQRFFLGWAQIWRRKHREPELLKRPSTDPDSPNEFRTNGVVSNLDAFYEAFAVEPTDRLYRSPEARVKIW